MIIQALGTCVARKRQKNNRRQRILREAEENKETGLHQLRRNVYKGFEEIADLELLKEKLEQEFPTEKKDECYIVLKEMFHLLEEHQPNWYLRQDYFRIKNVLEE